MAEIVKNEYAEAESNEHDEASLSYLRKAFNHYIFLLFVK
jgi:hypothetical protein